MSKLDILFYVWLWSGVLFATITYMNLNITQHLGYVLAPLFDDLSDVKAKHLIYITTRKMATWIEFIIGEVIYQVIYLVGSLVQGMLWWLTPYNSIRILWLTITLQYEDIK
jgi:hypothetical protein